MAHHNDIGLPGGIMGIIGIFIALAVLCSGCATVQPQLPPALSIEITRVVVHITEDRSGWPEGHRRPNVAGCSSSANEIWLKRGEFSNPEMVMKILGHELSHLIHWKDKRFPNPDEVTK